LLPPTVTVEKQRQSSSSIGAIHASWQEREAQHRSGLIGFAAGVFGIGQRGPQAPSKFLL
jgi:hypothetical protein